MYETTFMWMIRFVDNVTIVGVIEVQVAGSVTLDLLFKFYI